MVTQGVLSRAGWLALLVLVVNLKPSSQNEEHKELSYKAVTREDICSNRQVPIISVSEAKRLISELREDPSACPSSYVQSFYELEPILFESKDELICSEKKFNQIAAYHLRYINPRVEVYKTGDDLNHIRTEIKPKPLTESKFDYKVQLDDYKQEIMIPISLQQFFKAWALQVSGNCKRTLVANIKRAMQNYDDSDLDLIESQTSMKPRSQRGSKAEKNKLLAPIGEAMVHPITSESIADPSLSFRNLVYLPQFEGELQPGDIEMRAQTTLLDLRQHPELDKFMHACKYRFKPVYDQLVMPVVRLAKLGYDYVGPQIDNIRDKLDRGSDVFKWKLLTVLCESVGNFELTESKEEPILMEAYDYVPLISNTFGNDLWIKGAEALRRELDRIAGSNSKGLKRLLFKAGIGGRKTIAFIDPHQSAWYRRNQNTLSSALNSMSIISNLASIGVTVTG